MSVPMTAVVRTPLVSPYDAKRLSWVLAGVLGAIIVLSGIGIYGLGWTNAFTDTVANIVPFQAGSVNGKSISVADFDRIVMPYNDLNSKAVNKYSDKQLGQAAFDMAASQKLVETYARAHNISVSAEELRDQFNSLAEAAGGSKQLAAQVKKNFGLSLAQYKNQVYSRLLTRKVDLALKADPNRMVEAQNEAEKVLANLTIDSFEQVQSDRTGTSGLVDLADLPAGVAKVGAGLKTGTVSAAPVLADQIYYIVARVGTDSAAQFRLMPFPVSGLDGWLAQQKSAAKVSKYLPQTK